MSDVPAATSTIGISQRWTHLGTQNQVLISQCNAGRQTSLRKKAMSLWPVKAKLLKRLFTR